MIKLNHLCAILIIFVFPSFAISQKYKNKETSLISFNINIYPDTKQFLENLQGHFSPYKNPKADKIIGTVKEKTWAFLMDRLQTDIGMLILPLRTLGDNYSYDRFGFPDGNINKAIKAGESKYYMKIDMFIGTELNPNHPHYPKNPRDSISEPIQIQEGQIMPKVTINITMYSENGILPINKYTGIAIAPRPFDLTPYVLDGLVNTNNSFEPTTLMGIINEAIAEISINILAEE